MMTCSQPVCKGPPVMSCRALELFVSQFARPTVDTLSASPPVESLFSASLQWPCVMSCRALELFVSHGSVPLPEPGARCNNSGGAAGHGRLQEGYPGPRHQQDAVPAHPCSPPCHLPRTGAIPSGAGFGSAGGWSAVSGIMPQVNPPSFNCSCEMCPPLGSGTYDCDYHPACQRSILWVPQVQASARLGVGLLYQGSCHIIHLFMSHLPPPPPLGSGTYDCEQLRACQS